MKARAGITVFIVLLAFVCLGSQFGRSLVSAKDYVLYAAHPTVDWTLKTPHCQRDLPFVHVDIAVTNHTAIPLFYTGHLKIDGSAPSNWFQLSVVYLVGNVDFQHVLRDPYLFNFMPVVPLQPGDTSTWSPTFNGYTYRTDGHFHPQAITVTVEVTLAGHEEMDSNRYQRASAAKATFIVQQCGAHPGNRIQKEVIHPSNLYRTFALGHKISRYNRISQNSF